MALCAQVIARLQGLTVDGEAILSGRVAGAAALAALQDSGAFPQVTPAAHVVPTGLSAGQPFAMGGTTVPVERSFAVILTVRMHDATGRRWLDRIEELIDAITARLSGWTPDSTTRNLVQLEQAGIVSAAKGTAVYQLSFSLQDRMVIP